MTVTVTREITGEIEIGRLPPPRMIQAPQRNLIWAAANEPTVSGAAELLRQYLGLEGGPCSPATVYLPEGRDWKRLDYPERVIAIGMWLNGEALAVRDRMLGPGALMKISTLGD